jgi:hypothetical protein
MIPRPSDQRRPAVQFPSHRLGHDVGSESGRRGVDGRRELLADPTRADGRSRLAGVLPGAVASENGLDGDVAEGSGKFVGGPDASRGVDGSPIGKVSSSKPNCAVGIELPSYLLPQHAGEIGLRGGDESADLARRVWQEILEEVVQHPGVREDGGSITGDGRLQRFPGFAVCIP